MRVDLLDHGYCELIPKGCWGSDELIIEAARMSTNKGFQGWGDANKPGDERLLSYLWDNKHHTPFEMGGLTIEVQAPIFVFREWHRHRTQSYNEMSGRYIELPDLSYIPSIERIMASRQSSSNKQGSQEGFNELQAAEIRRQIEYATISCRETYEDLLGTGVSKEVARVVIPVNQYSRMRASANLRNWLGFLTLRMNPAAQWEIRQYANVVAGFVEQMFPRTYQLFMKGSN